MPNRNCDFCSNGYKINPTAGYYKLTSFMREALEIDKRELQLDYICGDHFEETHFLSNGRLDPKAIPSFFPRKECVKHDHNYISATDQLESESGMF